jgi:TIR domain
MFFISYSRQTDLPRAEALYQALLKLGVLESEVWFDRQAIDPGQDFRHRIFDGIRHSRYFLALLSYEGDRREEGFVFDEWQQANERKKSMNRDFVFPVILEAEYKPERFSSKPVRDGEWARLDFCHAPEGVPDDRMTTKLTQLLREARRGS